MKLGLIINPIAGIGGPAGLKGSDGESIQQEALRKGSQYRSNERTMTALGVIPEREKVKILAAPGIMGADAARCLGFDVEIIGSITEKTTDQDTERIALEMREHVDLLIFSGGDGTARNIYNAVGDKVPVIGIPAGVKIHSAVYAVSPESAGEVIKAFLSQPLDTKDAEVMDIDENCYRKGILKAQLYGYMKVPALKGRLQNPKAASHNSDEDVAGICHEIRERIRKEPDDTLFILGAGSTLRAIKKHLGFDGSLIGVDLYGKDHLIAEDLSEQELLRSIEGRHCKLIVTAIGGQGHIFGRGNQQLSPKVIRNVGIENIWVVATGSKIFSLPNQQLYVDTGDEKLDEQLRGYMKVINGWQETLVCRVL